MDTDLVISLAVSAMELALKVALPLLLVGLAVGLIISVFQAVTQIQEMTLSFIPKILAMVVVCTANALMRKLFNLSSNAFLEIQWYMFAAVFLLSAGHTLARNEHVRIDVLAGRLSARGQVLIDLAGTVLFLLPLCALVLYFGWPYFAQSFRNGEYSPNPGGLILWPVKLLIPLGFALLALQGLAQLAKQVAALTGRLDPATLVKSHHGPEPEAAPLFADPPRPPAGPGQPG